MKKRKQSGFTLVELMIAIAVIAIIAGIALPGFLSSRMSANESAAISTLKSIASAQAQVQVTNAIDTDGDGAGEFGYLGELSGLVPARVSVGGAPAVGTPGIDELDPTIVSAGLGNVQPDALGNGVVTRSGYVFKLFLPGTPVGGVIPGVPEAGTGGGEAGTLPDPNTSELLWSCYAWPVDASRTGSRVFFLNQESELLFFSNNDTSYTGLVTPGTIPSYDAAYVAGAGGMGSNLAQGGAVSNDGNMWVQVQ